VLNCVGGQLRNKESGDFDAFGGEAPALEDVDGVAAGPGDGVGSGGEGYFADGLWGLVHAGGYFVATT
jgi:hypothetical protein